MNEKITEKINEVDAAIYGAELSMSYYRGRVEAFEEARKLLAQSEMSVELKESEDAKAIAEERKVHRTGLSIDVVKFEQKLRDIIHSWGIPQESPDNVPEQLHQDALALLDLAKDEIYSHDSLVEYAKKAKAEGKAEALKEIAQDPESSYAFKRGVEYGKEEILKDLPKWDFAKPGTKLPGASVIIYNEDPDPRMGTVAVEDCIYIPIADLNRLPLLKLKQDS